jgi:hypothetical protein
VPNLTGRPAGITAPAWRYPAGESSPPLLHLRAHHRRAVSLRQRMVAHQCYAQDGRVCPVWSLLPLCSSRVPQGKCANSGSRNGSFPRAVAPHAPVADYLPRVTSAMRAPQCGSQCNVPWNTHTSLLYLTVAPRMRHPFTRAPAGAVRHFAVPGLPPARDSASIP